MTLLLLLFCQDLDDLARKLQKDVAKTRGLELKKDPKVGVYKDSELRDFITKEFERDFPRARAAKYQKVYAHFGLIPAKLDLFEAYVQLFCGDTAGFYDPKTKEIRLVQIEGMESQTEETLFHELIHALQDQHFDLRTLPIEEQDNEDLVVSIPCLLEGEAEYLTILWACGGDTREFRDVLRESIQIYQSAELEGKLAELPAYLRHFNSFPYGHGMEFMRVVLREKKGDWTFVSKMHADPPSSTEQILHPEKYLGDRDHPTILEFDDPKGWSRIESNVHGEFAIRILLTELGVPNAAAAAAGWDGDRYHVYDQETKTSSLWISTWDTEKDAVEFFVAYSKAMRLKHPDWKETESTATRLVLTGAILERDVRDVRVTEGDVSLKWGAVTRAELKEIPRYRKGTWTCPEHKDLVHDVGSWCPTCGAKLVEKE